MRNILLSPCFDLCQLFYPNTGIFIQGFQSQFNSLNKEENYFDFWIIYTGTLEVSIRVKKKISSICFSVLREYHF